jgi:hypothetical protein
MCGRSNGSTPPCYLVLSQETEEEQPDT